MICPRCKSQYVVEVVASGWLSCIVCGYRGHAEHSLPPKSDPIPWLLSGIGAGLLVLIYVL